MATAHLSRSGALQAQEDGECRVQFALTRIQGKWKIGILSKLQHGPVRLSQLRKMLPPSLKKELTPYVRELESAGLIVRIDRSGKRRCKVHCRSSEEDQRFAVVLNFDRMLTVQRRRFLDRCQIEVSLRFEGLLPGGPHHQ